MEMAPDVKIGTSGESHRKMIGKIVKAFWAPRTYIMGKISSKAPWEYSASFLDYQ